MGKSGKKQIKPSDKKPRNGIKGRVDILGNDRNNECRHCGNESYKNISQEKKLVFAARGRANQKGMECTVKPEDILIPKFCPILGLEMKADIGGGRKRGSLNKNAPSLDRVDNSIGYTKDNAIVISKRANSLKSDGEMQELLAVAAFLADYKMGRISKNGVDIPYNERSISEITQILLEYEKQQNNQCLPQN